MKMQTIAFASLCLSMAALSACDDDTIDPRNTGTLRIQFDNYFADTDLELGRDYVNGSGETLRISTLNYYISNITLHEALGQDYVLPQDSSYYLIMEDNSESQVITINGVPEGDYKKISFMIGVDSLRSTMDVTRRTGVLDPAQGHDGMYWTWNSGYIFFKMEGSSPAAPSEQEHKFYYHIGGYGGYDSPSLNNIRSVSISLGNARAEVRAGRTPKIHIHADVKNFFEGPNPFAISDHSLVMFADFSRKISENYVHLFKYDHVHN